MRQYISRSGILFTLIFLLYIFSAGCSEKSDSLSVGPVANSRTHHVRLDPRPNPLQEYIQDNWTNSDPSATGGSHYSHIKLYGHTYNNLEGNQDAADFIADHFDVFMWGGPIVGSTKASLNPSMLWLHEAGNIPWIRSGFDVNRVNAWLNDPVANPNGYDWADLLLYYKYNTTSAYGSYHGWNPADDMNGDGCIDSTEGSNGMPSDSLRSAQCQWDARFFFPIDGKLWLVANPASEAYVAFTENEAIYEWDHFGVEGFHFDEASYENKHFELQNTFQYENWTETDPDLPYIEDKIAFLPSVMSGVESYVGHPVVAIANMVSTYYTCNSYDYHGPQHDYALNYLENMWLEAWLPGLGYANTDRRQMLLECPLLDFLEEGKGLMLTYRENSASEQGKLFSLAMFYMINHQMAFYFYMINNASFSDPENTHWNQWAEYDVGQPVVNNLGFDDFLGQSGTTRFFVFESGSSPEYQVLGRQYQQSSGTRVLVLVKLMGPGQTPGSNGTTVSLNGSYKMLQSDLTLGTTVNSITLANNEGAILVKQSGSGCHGCGFEN